MYDNPRGTCNDSRHHIVNGFCLSCLKESDVGYEPSVKVIKRSNNWNIHNTDGSKTSFYDCKGCEDVDDLAEHWELKGDEFNCLKAIVGIAKGSRHDGTTPLRDAKKLVHYANRILKRIENDRT